MESVRRLISKGVKAYQFLSNRFKGPPEKLIKYLSSKPFERSLKFIPHKLVDFGHAALTRRGWSNLHLDGSNSLLTGSC
jgi:hypothetical protein